MRLSEKPKKTKQLDTTSTLTGPNVINLESKQAKTHKSKKNSSANSNTEEKTVICDFEEENSAGKNVKQDRKSVV
jgi:hypothetical protein